MLLLKELLSVPLLRLLQSLVFCSKKNKDSSISSSSSSRGGSISFIVATAARGATAAEFFLSLLCF